jgi:hypothetical protein
VLHNQVVDAEQKDKMYEYFLERAEADIILEDIERLENSVRMDEHRLEHLREKLAGIGNEQSEKQVIRDNLRMELASDKDFIARDEQKKKLEQLEEQKERLLEERKQLMDSVKEAKALVYKLLEKLRHKDTDKAETGEVDFIQSYYQQLSEIEHLTGFVELKDNLQRVLDYKAQASLEMHNSNAALNIEIQRNNQELQETRMKIENLEKKRLSYPPAVNHVMEAIQEEFIRIGRKPLPRVLCEMLEITDDTWRNAVEGYMNTQRFYILVEPENFDIALGVYDRLRKEKKAYGVGLINTQKLDQYDSAPDNSLATVVTSKNKYAKQYINMILGKVIMCEHFSDLKKYKTSITRECMKYQNHVANAIKPEVFETPYIGKNAVKVQLFQAREKRDNLERTKKELEKKLVDGAKMLELLTTDYDIDIKYRLDVLVDLQKILAEIENCKVNIKTLEKNSNMIQKNLQLETLDNILKKLANDVAKTNKEIGGEEQNIINTKGNIARRKGEHIAQKSLCTELAASAGELITDWNLEYNKQVQYKEITQFKENYGKTRKGNQTRISNIIENMQSKMVDYKTAHDFGAAATMDGYADFEAEYIKLKNSELLQYEEKVENARQAAEEEFREQFLAKLQENMKTAQAEFKELNKALKGIPFGSEYYEFLFMPSKNYRHYYDMIMDDFNAMQGESIFAGLFHENHKEVIEELFDRLALDKDNSGKALDEFTDYRTYMDYDIKILHSDGNYSLYSKVCEEKSGGETQTPFYVTIAASFVQLYKNNIGGEAVGLVMFDEAFNNMDDERIGGVLEFLKLMPLQIIIAAPPDKIQYISPYAEETLLVMTDEKVSYVERYVNGAVR